MAVQKLRPSNKINEDKLIRLREIVPDAFKDNLLDFNSLYEGLSDFIPEDEFDIEHFGLQWPGKKEAKRIAATPSAASLAEVSSSNKVDVKNAFIEGENLEVLKLLQKSYNELIRLIYIDPPYNTGKDFIYEDDFTETIEDYLNRTGQVDEKGRLLSSNTKADGRYHSKWLSMMYPRLKLARNLLTDDGVIFVSIDDNEIHNLKALMNEIFGEENFLVQLIWKSGRTSSGHYTVEHEYILGFCKTKEGFKYYDFHGDQVISDRAIKRPSAKNPVSDIDFPAGIDFEGDDKIFPKRFGKGEPVEVVKGVFECKNSKLVNPVTLRAAWTMRDQIQTWLNGEEVTDQKGQKVDGFFFKANGVLQYRKKKGTLHPKSVIEGITTKAGSNEIIDLFDEKVFDFPKPTKLLSELILPVVINSTSICLDFFAGSGSFGHAIYNILSEYKSTDASFILVQIPDGLNKSDDSGKAALKLGYKTIADVTKARLELAAKKIDPKGSSNLKFRHYKLTKSNFKEWIPYNGTDTAQLEMQFASHESSLINDWKREDLLIEILLLEGFPLDSKIEQVDSLKKNIVLNVVSDLCEHALYICLDDKVSSDTIKALILNDNDIFICLDTAVTDQDKARLDDKGLIKVI